MATEEGLPQDELEYTIQLAESKEYEWPANAHFAGRPHWSKIKEEHNSEFGSDRNSQELRSAYEAHLRELDYLMFGIADVRSPRRIREQILEIKASEKKKSIESYRKRIGRWNELKDEGPWYELTEEGYSALVSADDENRGYSLRSDRMWELRNLSVLEALDEGELLTKTMIAEKVWNPEDIIADQNPISYRNETSKYLTRMEADGLVRKYEGV